MTFTPTSIVVTGGAGFIGSNFIRWVLEHSHDVHIINYDALTYAGNLESLEDVHAAHGPQGSGRYSFVHGDVRDLELLAAVLGSRAVPNGTPTPDCIIHMAAESHVDRSIMGPSLFVDTNIRGTQTVLEACRGELSGKGPFRFIQVGTDEVYGSLSSDAPAFTETTPLAPNSPYSASKAGADLLVRSYVETFDFPAIITRCSNNYGPYQFPEKLIPLMITRALADQPLPVYGDGLNVRDWLHVDDHAAAIWAVIRQGKLGEVYNIGGDAELPNITVVRSLLECLGKPESLIQYVDDRAGHDRRYAMNTDRIRRELGWRPSHQVKAGMSETVQWYLENRTWWERVLTEAYRATNALYFKSS